jgi:hypothetical protein
MKISSGNSMTTLTIPIPTVTKTILSTNSAKESIVSITTTATATATSTPIGFISQESNIEEIVLFTLGSIIFFILEGLVLCWRISRLKKEKSRIINGNKRPPPSYEEEA